ncbi:MAG: hypothetical protein J7647_23165 [Cyanobacteria bacterium SBLK]|nr:hypothetical protein [Cyanobacteria bacterium SBLK]
MKKINLEECDPKVREFFSQLEGNENVIIYKDEKPYYFFGEIDDFSEEVRSLSNNQEFLDFLDRCRQRGKTEGTLSLSEVRRRLALES